MNDYGQRNKNTGSYRQNGRSPFDYKREMADKRRKREAEKRRKTERITSCAVIGGIILILLIMITTCAKHSGRNKADTAVTPAPTEASSPAPTPLPSYTGAALPQAKDADSNDLLDLIMDSGVSHTAYLTFDDGPNDTTTPQILDTLAEYNAKATFFTLGKMLEEHPDVAQRAADEGHLLAPHSYSHKYDVLYSSEESFKKEIEDTYDIICGFYPEDAPPMRIMRFPGGSFGTGSYSAEKQRYKKTLKGMNFYYVDWNCLDGDAEGTKKNADELFEYFKSTISTNNIVILMHDTKAETAEALPRIIEYLIENDWAFGTLADIPY